MEHVSLLEKLALEVSKNDSKQSESKGNKPGTGNEKAPGGKGFPPKSEKSKDGGGNQGNKAGGSDEKKGGKAPPFGKKTEGEEGEDSQNGNGGKEENNNVNGEGNPNGAPQAQGNGSGPGGEQEIEGNESAEGPAVPGSGSVDIKAIVDFFAQNPVPDDESYHEFAESQGYDIHQAEAAAYALAGKYVMFLRGGKSGGQDLSQIDQDQLNKGIEVEQEHTSDPTTAKKIALDHLIELPDYYTRLEQMESAGGQVVAEPKGQPENTDQGNGKKENYQGNGKEESKGNGKEESKGNGKEESKDKKGENPFKKKQ
jgi:hypothetical protein